jgi:hypothetical protein
MGGFIVGFDNDPDNIFELQADFIQKSSVVVAMVGILSALPNTRLWNRLQQQNRLSQESASGDNVNSETNILPLIGKENLKTGYKKLLLEIYSKKNYYKRINTLLKNYRPSVVSRVNRNDVHALFKALWKIGVLSKGERRLFWKVILKTAFTNTKALPGVVSYVILGRHFHEVSKKL